MSVILTAAITLAAIQIVGSGCDGDTGNYYVSENSRIANGGGTLKSYAERQKYGNSPVNGNARTVTYRVYADYAPNANQIVDFIRTTWTVRATYNRPISGSVKASLTVGIDEVGIELEASSSQQWQDLAITKYWANSNGATHSYYGPSEYVLFPADQMYSHAVSNVAYVKLSNQPTPTEITVTA